MRLVRQFLCASGLAERHTAELTVAAVQRHLNQLRLAGKSAKTLLNVRSALSRFCEHLISRGLLERNVCRDVKCRSAEQIAPPVLHERTRLEELFAAADAGGIGPAVRLAAATGLRLSELARLAWVDVDLSGRTLLVKKSKAKRCRVVPLNQAAMAALAAQQAYLDSRPDGKLDWVFPARKTFTGGYKLLDRPCSANAMLDRFAAVKRQFAEFDQLPGKRVGRAWHLLRHTFASRLAERNVNLKKLADWLGHSDIKMTARYVHLRRTYDADIELAG